MSTDLVKLAERMENIARHMTYNTEPESIWKHGLNEIAARLASMQTEAPAVPKEAESHQWLGKKAIGGRVFLEDAFAHADAVETAAFIRGRDAGVKYGRMLATSPSPAASTPDSVSGSGAEPIPDPDLASWFGRLVESKLTPDALLYIVRRVERHHGIGASTTSKDEEAAS